MRDLPIPFSPPMVRALLREIEKPGTGKTQTRRVLNSDVHFTEWLASETIEDMELRGWSSFEDARGNAFMAKPRFSWGDCLYVREHWRSEAIYDDLSPSEMGGDEPIRYEADGAHQTWGYPAISKLGRFRQGMHMPRWASRLTLIVTEVRVQRLQEIEPDDCYAEGVKCDMSTRTVVEHFRNLWDRLNADREGGRFAWEANPWVAAYTFRPVLGNIDQIDREAA